MSYDDLTSIPSDNTPSFFFCLFQMEIEKKKAKKFSEQKKAVDTRLDQEMKRNTELQKEMYR